MALLTECVMIIRGITALQSALSARRKLAKCNLLRVINVERCGYCDEMVANFIREIRLLRASATGSNSSRNCRCKNIITVESFIR